MKTALLIIVPFTVFYGSIAVGLCIVALRGRHERRNETRVFYRFSDFDRISCN